MGIYSSESLPLFEEWKVAREEENVAIAALHDALKVGQSGNRDMAMLSALTKQMEDTHNESMDIFDRLQAFRLDAE